MLLRKILMSTVVLVGAMGAASASDLPTTKGPPAYIPPPPVFTWTGLYAGGQVGYQWGTTDTNIYGPAGTYLGSVPSYSDNGFTGGVHVGYNYQIGQFVVGLEADANGLAYRGNDTAVPLKFTFTGATNETVDGSIRGRVGYAFDHALFYATGGLAIGEFNNTSSVTYHVDPSFSWWTTRLGWTVGGGIEYALSNNWSVRGEYRYTDYGSFNETYGAPFSGYYARVHLTDNRVQLGISYKFDWFAPPLPVVAKY